MKETDTLNEIRREIDDFIEKNDIFWLNELSVHLGVESTESSLYKKINRVCREYVKEEKLIVSDKKSQFVQYMRR